MILLDPSSYKRKAVYTQITYGYLYNWYATADERGITHGDFRVPSYDDLETKLRIYVDVNYVGANAQGWHLKSCRTSISPVSGCQVDWDDHPVWRAFTVFPADYRGRNTLNFNGTAPGVRRSDVAIRVREYCFIWAASAKIYELAYDGRELYAYDLTEQRKPDGNTIRLCRDASLDELSYPDGTACALYLGNDGKKYRTVKIGELVWIADNLAETKYANGDWINGFNDGVYTPITDATWYNLTTGALCAYNDDLTLV
jgi:hypothetical protein